MPSLSFTCSVFLSLMVAAALPGQRCSSVDLREGANGNISPVDWSTTSEIGMTDCLTAPLLNLALPSGSVRRAVTTLTSTQIVFNGADFPVGIRLDFTDSPVDALLAVCGLFPVCPVPILNPCGPQVVQQADFGGIRGGIGANVRAAGGGFSGGATFTRIGTAEWCLSDRLEFDSPVQQTIEVPITIDGSIVAAESFGDPNGTFGKAELSVSGTVFGQSVSEEIRVESISTIPETRSIRQTIPVRLVVPAGRSVHGLQLTARAKIETRAQSAGFFGTIVGAATAAVNAPSRVAVGRIRGVNDQSLAPGTRITGLDTGTNYSELLGVESPYLLIPGCSTGGGLLYPRSAGAPLGGQLDIIMASDAFATGTTTLLAGLKSTDSQRCGAIVPGVGELLLATNLPPIDAVAATLTAGRAMIALPIPNDPVLDGLQLDFQAATIASGAVAVSLSSGLRVTLNR